jgi:hypothetical protein
MTKAVFTTKVNPSYKDLPEQRYHFPRTYLNYVQQTVGDYIVYYEPRRSSVELSSRGGRQSYFGVARVHSVIEDRTLADHFFAIIDGSTYLDFDTAVPFLRAKSTTRAHLRRCAITGLKLINGGGRPEVQAAHIQPVACKARIPFAMG